MHSFLQPPLHRGARYSEKPAYGPEAVPFAPEPGHGLDLAVVNDSWRSQGHPLGPGLLQATRRRTVVGLDQARVEGKILGPPRKLDPDQVETARRLRREKVSLREIGRQFRVSASAVDRYLKEEDLES